MPGVPFASTRWDQIIPNLAMGGHDWNNAENIWDSDVILTDEFDVVFSLFRRVGHGPDEGVEHHMLRIPDGFLTDTDVQGVRQLADLAEAAVRAQRRTMVRCQAGYNRSGLVVAFTLLRLGYSASDAIDLIREKRSLLALHNVHFVSLIFAEAVRLGRESAAADPVAV